jgi:exopolysaccharide biosynthesis predicted pyruvyltransferase EpsI
LRKDLEAHGGPTNTAIMFHGGGNFGDIWSGDQKLREKVVADFPDYPIRSFPQTYKFKNPKTLARVQEIYGKHPDLQLTVRDTLSYTQLELDFGSKHQIMLAPDAATMLFTVPIPAYPTQEYKFLVQLRGDNEGGQNHNTERKLFEELKNPVPGNNTTSDTAVLQGDWQNCEPSGLARLGHVEQSLKRVEAARDWLNSAQLVLSDRLHVHILSTLWGIDHIVIEEGWYRKVMTYQDTWLSECTTNVALTSSVREGVDIAKAWYERGGTFL